MLRVTHQMGFARDISDRVCFFYGVELKNSRRPNCLVNRRATAPRTFFQPSRKRCRPWKPAGSTISPKAILKSDGYDRVIILAASTAVVAYTFRDAIR